jgi:hypothetical protein
LSKVLLKYVPEEAVPLMADWLKTYKLHLTISKTRQSKLGDFRPAFGNRGARISVNGDLNPYHFLITFTHEVAHAAVWEKHANKVFPHGEEWKQTYTHKLQRMTTEVPFPNEVQNAINKHLSRPKASSCADPSLYKVLKKFDKDADSIIYLDELEEGQLFSINKKRRFKKGKKRRSRYECIDLENKRMYYVSAHAEVKPLE